MINVIILVFVGGAIGAMLREFIMLMVPHAEGFPLDILVANLIAAFLLGLVTALHKRAVLTDDVNSMLGTGVMGGLSTFSSMVYGALILMMTSTSDLTVAILYLLANLILGYIVVILGLKLGGDGVTPAPRPRIG
ncbi:CrcB family protein [Hyphomicrobium sp. ghe19]|uniref:CrcB family protein n=1 Tax=Hyphomicrobium sp. ghe19 TaxID=2682968 RepID=UPI0013678204|nr:Putative fluoride ion transporter CrcB [Hyphomicrobium sp. ghe19]